MADATEPQVMENGGDAPPQKTAKQLEKEAKKQAKLDKLKQKLEKQSAQPKKENAEVRHLPYVFDVSIFMFDVMTEKREEEGKRTKRECCLYQ